jgi:hypothetical protein
MRILSAPGTSPYYFKAQIRGAATAISRLEYMCGQGLYHQVPRQPYNYFVLQGGIDADKTKTGPYSFRITDIYGQQVYAHNIGYAEGAEVPLDAAFAPVACPDCSGALGGSAYTDMCGQCTGGGTGIVPNSACKPDCAGYWNGTAYTDSCGSCVSGQTGLTPCNADCNGVLGGSAFIDNCGYCAAGDTGRPPCTQDCIGEWGGTNLPGSCGSCYGINIEHQKDECHNKRQLACFEKGWNQFSLEHGFSPAHGMGAALMRSNALIIKDSQEFWMKSQPGYLNLLENIQPNIPYRIYMEMKSCLLFY